MDRVRFPQLDENAVKFHPPLISGPSNRLLDAGRIDRVEVGIAIQCVGCVNGNPLKISVVRCGGSE